MTYCGDHFTVNTNIKSLCCTPETNMLYVNCTSKEKKKEKTKTNREQTGGYLRWRKGMGRQSVKWVKIVKKCQRPAIE